MAEKTVDRRHERHALVHARTRRRGRFTFFRRLGPGLITGAADDDPSGIGTYSQLGAGFGLAMLWTVPISLPFAAAVEELAGRLGLAGKEGLATLIKKHFPPPVLYVAAALVAGANTFNVGADLGAMVASLRLIISIPFVPLLITITAVLLVLEVFVEYRQYARPPGVRSCLVRRQRHECRQGEAEGHVAFRLPRRLTTKSCYNGV